MTSASPPQNPKAEGQAGSATKAGAKQGSAEQEDANHDDGGGSWQVCGSQLLASASIL